MKHIRPPLSASPVPVLSPSDNERKQDLHPADELAQIRAAMTKLRIREAALLDHFRNTVPKGDDCPAQLLHGEGFRVKLTSHERRVFDPSRLPQAALANPQFYRRERQTLVTTLPQDTPPNAIRVC